MEPGKKQLKSFRRDNLVPLVSIITPFYNAGRYILQTFQSVVNQTFPWFEWIIVDDGSTKQEDVQLLNSLAEKDSRIHIYRKDNGGPSTARNLAISMSVTDIIIPLDADDLIIPTYAELLYWGLYFNKDYDWCYTNNLGFDRQTYLWKEEFDSERLRTYNYLVYSGAIRKKALEEIGGYDVTVKNAYEDWQLWLNLIAAGKKPVKLSVYGFWYRRLDTGNLSLVNGNQKLKEAANQLIESAAAKVKQTVKAKAFPNKEEKETWQSPQIIPWEYGVVDQGVKIKQNLLLLIPWMEMGGADLFNLNVVKGLDKSAYNISIITTVPGENKWRQQFEEEVYEVFELPSFLEVRNYLSFMDYFIKSRNINIILLSNSYLGYYMLPWLRATYPKIIIMDYVHMEEWYWKNGGYARISGAYRDVIDRTYTCNDRTTQVLVKQFNCDKDKVKTLYIGTDIHRFDPEKVSKNRIYERYGIDRTVPIILFPCRIHPQKRPFLMLEIVKKLSGDKRKFIVLVVGSGSQQSEVMDKAKEMHLQDKIIFTGEQKDMPEFYQDSFVTLICSIKEGLALTAYESLAMGTPVISTEVGGQKELITEEVGYLLPLLQNEATDLDKRIFEEKEINQFAEAIEGLMDNPGKYKEMCRKARERIVARFSVERMIAELEKELLELKTLEYRKKREQLADSLRMLSGLIDESVLLAVENTITQSRIETIWNERVWYQNLYQELKHQPWKRREGYQKSLLYRGIRKIYLRLKKIWKQKLRYTRMGKMLRKGKTKIFAN